MADDNDILIRRFIDLFQAKDVGQLEPYLHPDVVFRNYGDAEVRGRDGVLELWRDLFQAFETVRFETVNQAVNGEIVLAEQVHGMGRSGGQVADIMTMAVFEVRDGQIRAWRNYTDRTYANQLL